MLSSKKKIMSRTIYALKESGRSKRLKTALDLHVIFLGGNMLISDEVKSFIKDITLFLQKHSNYNPEKIEPMFQRAYKLYVKYDVENNQEIQLDNDKPVFTWPDGEEFDYTP